MNLLSSLHGMQISRREAMRLGLWGATGLLMSGGSLMPGRAAAAPGKAKSVIQIWMWGGPSHLDTFDPKPAAGYDYCGPLDKPIRTNVDGIVIGELLPLLAQQADKYSIIRSMTHGINAHETASYMVQTGRKPGERLVYPCVGAVVSLFRGYNAGYSGLIPPYMVLTQPQGRFSEDGFLGQRYKPFATGGDPAQARFAVEGIVAQGITDQRQQDRRELLHQLDTLGKAMKDDAAVKTLDQAEQQAYELILGDGGKVFDLSQEKDEMKDRYGRNTFGQSCLVARRLVEKGVPLYHHQLSRLGYSPAAFSDHAPKIAADGSGHGNIAPGLVGSRPAGQHDHLVERGIRQDAQGAVGSALEWRARALRAGLLRCGRRRRIQGRPRGRGIGANEGKM